MTTHASSRGRSHGVRLAAIAAMSMKWFGADYTTPAGAFDLSKRGQQIP